MWSKDGVSTINSEEHGKMILTVDVEDPEPDFSGYLIPLDGQDPDKGASLR